MSWLWSGPTQTEPHGLQWSDVRSQEWVDTEPRGLIHHCNICNAGIAELYLARGFRYKQQGEAADINADQGRRTVTVRNIFLRNCWIIHDVLFWNILDSQTCNKRQNWALVRNTILKIPKNFGSYFNVSRRKLEQHHGHECQTNWDLCCMLWDLLETSFTG